MKDNQKRSSVGRQVSGARRGMQLKALLSLGLLAGIGAVSTLAAWTGGATATSEIGAGTVAIGVGAPGSSAGAEYTLRVDGANWYPGMNRAAMVTVQNTGTLSVPYSVSGSVTETGVGKLGAGLRVRVTSGSVVGGVAGNATCNGAEVLNKNPSSGFPAPSILPELAADDEQALCVQYSLPTDAPNSLQGNSTTITLTFTATAGVS